MVKHSSVCADQQLVSKNEVRPASKSYKVFNRSCPKPRLVYKMLSTLTSKSATVPLVICLSD